jgi:hypothetical protein
MHSKTPAPYPSENSAVRPLRKPRKKRPVKMVGRAVGLNASRVGLTHGRLTVIADVPGTRSRVLCRCECGAEKEVSWGNMQQGGIRSCGCLYRESRFVASRTHGHKAGGKVSKVYRAWQAMKMRCYGTLPINASYLQRGTVVCDRWLNGEGGMIGFECFAKDVGSPPSRLHTLERIDNNGNYEPGNCRWDTRLAQGNNKRNNVFLEHEGKRLTLAQWAREKGITYACLRYRLREWGAERTLNAN